MPPRTYAPIEAVAQPGGITLLRPGKPLGIEPELLVSQFAKMTKISDRHARRLYDEGKIKGRRLTPAPRSRILIPVSEAERFLSLHD